MNSQEAKNWWSGESEAFARVMDAMEKGTAKIIEVEQMSEDGPYKQLAITAGGHPGYDTLFLQPTGQENVYKFSTYNQVAGGTINGVIAANPETGKYLPVADYTKQIQYTPGSSGGFLKNILNDIGPVGNIALALATAGTSIPTQLAAQAALNMAKGQDFGDALKGAALAVGGSQLAQGVMGGGGGLSPEAGSLGSASDLPIGNVSKATFDAANAGLGGLAEGAFPGLEPGAVATDTGIAGLTPSLPQVTTSPVTSGAVTETPLPSATPAPAATPAPGGIENLTPELNVGQAQPAPSGGVADLINGPAPAQITPTPAAAAPTEYTPEVNVSRGMPTAAQEADALDQWMKDYYANQPQPQPSIPGTSGGETGGGIAELPGQGEGAFPGVEPGTVGMDQLPKGIETLPTPTSTIPGQGEGAFPGAEPGTVGMDQTPGGIETLPTPTSTIPGQGEGAFPGTEPGTVGMDQPIVPAAPSIPGQGEGAFPGTEPGTVATDNVPGNGLTPAAPNLLQKFADATGLPIGVVNALATGLGLKAAGALLAPDQAPGGAPTAGGPGPGFSLGANYEPYKYKPFAAGGITDLGGYSDGGRLLRGPGDGVSDSIPATIGGRQPARLADGEFVIPARIVSEIGNGSTDAGARKLYEMMDRVQAARRKTMGKNKFAANTKADKHLPI